MEWKIISVQNSYISKKSEPKSKCNTISRSWTHFHNIRILNFGQSMNLMRHFYSKRDYNITHKQLIKYTVSIVVFDEMVLLQNLSKHENNERIFFLFVKGVQSNDVFVFLFRNHLWLHVFWPFQRCVSLQYFDLNCCWKPTLKIWKHQNICTQAQIKYVRKMWLETRCAYLERENKKKKKRRSHKHIHTKAYRKYGKL